MRCRAYLTENCSGVDESSPQANNFLPILCPPTLPYASFSALLEEEMDPIPPFIRHRRPISWHVFHFSRHEYACRHVKIGPDGVGFGYPSFPLPWWGQGRSPRSRRISRRFCIKIPGYATDALYEHSKWMVSLPCGKLHGVLDINQAMKIRCTALNWQECTKRQQQCTVNYVSVLKFRNDEIQHGDKDMFIWHLKTDRLF